MTEIKIVTEKINGCEDSFFYDGEVAYAKKDNGTMLSLIACGDIKIRIGEDVYKNNQIDEAISKYNLTDEKLKRWEEQGKIEWLNNNWFEVTFLKQGSEFWESVLCDVAHEYDDGLELLRGYIEDEEL